MPNADGPDISHFQQFTGIAHDPTWRLYAHKCSEGKSAGDSMFAARWAWMRSKQFKYRGAYHWLRSDSTMALQAANLCARIDATGGLLRGEFVQADWETTPNVPYVLPGQVAEWSDRVEQHFGRQCVIVYSSDWVPSFVNWRNLHPDAPLWYANYNTGPGTNGGNAECVKWDAAVWQWTSSFVHASIVGRFDMNHIIKPAVLDALTDQVPPPPPKPEAPPVVYFYRHKAYQNVWLVGPGGAVAVAGDVVTAGTLEGVPMIVNDHPQSLQSALVTSGLRFDDLEAV